mmetsp:Transcript_33249/g.116602  ORF Transcript_33249/g.116602 Transcript_33249/m.116602 type:complete len:243 (-) Transcript_33249:96-824(-)
MAYGVERAFYELQMATSTTGPNGQPNPDSALVAILYDMVDPARKDGALARPPHVRPEAWDAAVQNNPDPESCVPTAVVGFEALLQRCQLAKAACERNEDFAVQIAAKADLLQRASNLNAAAADDIRARNAALSLRLLRVLRKLEVVRCADVPVHAEERKVLARLRRLEQDAREPTRLLDAASRAAHALAAMQRPAHFGADADTLAALRAALMAHNAGLEQLTDVALKDSRDLGIIRGDALKH